MNANGQLIEILARSDMFQDYERAYTEATGRASATFARFAEDCGLSALGWAESLWAQFEPPSGAEVPHLTRIGILSEKGKKCFFLVIH